MWSARRWGFGVMTSGRAAGHRSTASLTDAEIFVRETIRQWNTVGAVAPNSATLAHALQVGRVGTPPQRQRHQLQCRHLRPSTGQRCYLVPIEGEPTPRQPERTRLVDDETQCCGIDFAQLLSYSHPAQRQSGARGRPARTAWRPSHSQTFSGERLHHAGKIVRGQMTVRRARTVLIRGFLAGLLHRIPTPRRILLTAQSI